MKRQVTPQELAAVERLGVPGLGVTQEPKRFYPQRELGAPVLGMVGTDGHGVEGLEVAFEDELSGRSGKVQGNRDARGRSLLLQGASESAERQGATVTLTLDRQIQYASEKALDRAVEDSRATAGMLVVLDPRTGELLAMAQSPRFNGNNPVGLGPQQLRDRPALDLYEPGSTYKAFVAAQALEDGSAPPRRHLRLRERRLGGGEVRHPRHPSPRDVEPRPASSRSPRTSARPRSPSGSAARG